MTYVKNVGDDANPNGTRLNWYLPCLVIKLSLCLSDLRTGNWKNAFDKSTVEKIVGFQKDKLSFRENKSEKYPYIIDEIE